MIRRLTDFLRTYAFAKGLLALVMIVCTGNTLFISGFFASSQSVVEKTSEAEEESPEENRCHLITAASRRKSGWNLDKARTRSMFTHDLKLVHLWCNHFIPEPTAPEPADLLSRIPLFIRFSQLKYHL